MALSAVAYCFWLQANFCSVFLEEDEVFPLFLLATISFWMQWNFENLKICLLVSPQMIVGHSKQLFPSDFVRFFLKLFFVMLVIEQISKILETKQKWVLYLYIRHMYCFTMCFLLESKEVCSEKDATVVLQGGCSSEPGEIKPVQWQEIWNPESTTAIWFGQFI